MQRVPITVLLLGLFFWTPELLARNDKAGSVDFQPDPASVQRYEAGYRYPQAGWIVLHVEGAPYERGYQHGRLMAPEIAAYLRCFAAIQSPKAPTEGWKNTRSLVNALFVRRYEKEFLEEMKGIADGATAAGARFVGRPIDLVDIVGLNSWPEVETLDSALEATVTGLEGMRFPHRQPRALPDPKPMHCSAFAATGPATADGKIVFGHITMFGLYPSLFYNVWLDVKPSQGHRVLMQSYPGGIQSGMDYYLNDAGLLVSETTLAQTNFDIKGMTVASRIRQVLQYADSIDKAVEILEKSNNGLYTNEWLLADIKTNEIAMFELGTARSKLYRSSKNQWFSGTEGFYWGCNNTKDHDVRLETIPGVKGRPANVVWHPSDRDKAWLQLYAQHKGKIDVEFGKLAFTTAPLASFASLDAKFTTTDMAKDLRSWALYGPPMGKAWKPTAEEQQRFPEIRTMASNPWAVLHAQAPVRSEKPVTAAVDLHNPSDAKFSEPEKHEDEKPLPTVAAWHGTLFPKTDADAWLAAAFADYEKLYAREKAMREADSNGKLTPANRDRLAVDLYAYRVQYLAGAAAGADQPLAKLHGDPARDDWYRLSVGKGVLILNELRQILGDKTFEKMMDQFGRENAGKEVTSAQFRAHAEDCSCDSLVGFFDFWLNQPGLPKLKLSQARVSPKGKGFQVEGEIQLDGAPLSRVELVVETAKGKVAKQLNLEGAKTTFSLEVPERPKRLLVDPCGSTAKSAGGAFGVLSFHNSSGIPAHMGKVDNVLIVYGTVDETAANREAAENWQRVIRRHWNNRTVPIKADHDVTDAEMKGNHLLLIGRPDCNKLVERFRYRFPITFASRSFQVRQDTYAHPGSAVVAAGTNPLNEKCSMVVLAGLSAASTLSAPALLSQHGQGGAEVVVLPHLGKIKGLVVPAPELVHEFEEKVAKGSSK